MTPGPAHRRTDTRDPHLSREQAVRILFQADVRAIAPQDVLARLVDDAQSRSVLDDGDDLVPEPADVDAFARTLVSGVMRERDELDERIARFARRWQISRMPVVDRTVLRLATYELLREPTPAAVVIDEAVELAKALSTDDSGRYVNGVLDSIRKDLDATRTDDPDAEAPSPDAEAPSPDVEAPSTDADAPSTDADGRGPDAAPPDPLPPA